MFSDSVDCALCGRRITSDWTIVQEGPSSLPDFSILWKARKVSVCDRKCPSIVSQNRRRTYSEFDWRQHLLVIIFFSLSILFELTQLISSIELNSLASSVGKFVVIPLLGYVIYVNVMTLRSYALIRSNLESEKQK